LLLVFTTINEAASKVLYPRLVGRAIGLHEVLVLFVLFAGLEVDGVPGVLFAAPVTAIGLATVIHLYRYWLNLPDSLIFKPERSAPAGSEKVL
jgi:predicted PurR-regulated permease PerM